MDNGELIDENNVSQEVAQDNTGLEVINIPLLNVPVDGTNNISLSRLLSQHGITLQAGPGIGQLTNSHAVTINILNTSSQNDNITTTDLIDSTSHVVFSTDNVENSSHSNDGLPIVGNQMLCVPNMTQTLTFVTDYSTIPDVVVNNGDVPVASFLGDSSLQYKIQSYELFEDKKIFSHVVAFLAPDICTEMFTNYADYMNQIEKSEVFQLTKQEGSCTIAGELWALVMLQKRVQSLLRARKLQPTHYTKPEFCNKWVQTDKPETTDSAIQTHYPVKKEGLVNCGTMCEILLPSVTAFGREIKQSGRYNTNATTFLSHSVDEDMDEEYTPRSSRRKRKFPKRAFVSTSSDPITRSKGEKVKQGQRIVIVQNDVVSVEDCKPQINHSVAIEMESLQTSAETAVNGVASDSNNKKIRQPINGQTIDTKIVNTLECYSMQPKKETVSLDNIQEVAMETKSPKTNNIEQNYISLLGNTGSQNSNLLSAENTTCTDLNVANFIQSDVNDKLGAGEEFLTLTSASDFTPITSEDSLENDISNTTDLNPALSSSQNGENSSLGTTSLPQIEDQIQAALRASQISFEEVPGFQGLKSKPNLKKKSKKDYEAATPYKYFCDKCSFKSKRQSHLLKHMKFHDTVRKMFYCTQCSFKTIRNGALRRHEMSHSANIMHCNQCKYVTDDFISLDRHMKLKHDLATSKKKKKTVYKCPKCDYSSMMPSRYAAHLRLHKDLSGSGNSDIMLALQHFEEKNEEPHTYHCSLCTYKSIRKEHLVRHINNVHTDHRPFLCDICGQSFKRKDALSQHKITHVDKLNRNYNFQCTICKKTFRSKTHLNEHMAMHSSVRQFLCDICGTAFKTRSCQQKHIKSIHQNPRSFECSQCMKRFNTKFALLRHLRTHEKSSNIAQSVSRMEPMPSQIFHTLDSQPATLVQDIITTEGEVFETTEDNLQQVLLKTNDSNESATAIMYLPTSLQPSCF